MILMMGSLCLLLFHGVHSGFIRLLPPAPPRLPAAWTETVPYSTYYAAQDYNLYPSPVQSTFHFGTLRVVGLQARSRLYHMSRLQRPVR